MIKGKKISIVIPCKNEEKVIGLTIESIPSYVDEVIVVDNGSSDNTFDAASKFHVKVLREGRKLNGIGYGFAILKGLNQAIGDIIVVMDGDNTYPSSEIENIVSKMENENLDFVSCNRLPLKNKFAISKTRQLGIKILNLEVRVLYGRKVNDILTGMWCVRKDAVRKLNLKMGDWNLSPEVKISALSTKGIRFSEYHIDHFVREKEPSKQMIWKTGFNHLFYIFGRRLTKDNPLFGLGKTWIRQPSTSPVFD